MRPVSVSNTWWRGQWGSTQAQSGGDSIFPGYLSQGVTAKPDGTTPSIGADTIYGEAGNDYLDGGGGGDTIYGGAGEDYISASGAGNLIHGDGGNDAVLIANDDTGGANPADNVAHGDDGDDGVGFLVVSNPEFHPWTGDLPAGTVKLYGGAGDDTLYVGEYYLQAPGLKVELYGGAGADYLSATRYVWEPDGSHSGGNNPDFLYGGAGDDTYRVYEQRTLLSKRPGKASTRSTPAISTTRFRPMSRTWT